MIEPPNLPIIQSSEGRAGRMRRRNRKKLKNLRGLSFRFDAIGDSPVFVKHHPIRIVVDPNVTVFLQTISSRSRARGDNSMRVPPHLRDMFL